jgi:hypothetical protein
MVERRKRKERGKKMIGRVVVSEKMDLLDEGVGGVMFEMGSLGRSIRDGVDGMTDLRHWLRGDVVAGWEAWADIDVNRRKREQVLS